MQGISELAASRAARAEHERTRRGERYERALLALLGNRPPERHDEPITDQEHLTAAQYVAACEAYERATHGAVPRGNGTPAAPVAEVPRAKRTYRRRKPTRAKREAAPAAGG